MDFGALRYRYQEAVDASEDSKAVKAGWGFVPKAAESGWYVPLNVGYQAIAPVMEPGELDGARDSSIPSQFVESIYGVGQWLAPHRAKEIPRLMWRYQHDGGQYRCHNSYNVDSE